MSRVAKNPVAIPAGVNVTLQGQLLTIKGGKGSLQLTVHAGVNVVKDDKSIQFSPKPDIEIANAVAGTTRAIVNNIVIGVTKGFEQKLVLVGVGYRAQAQGKKLALTLGYSHPVNYTSPEGITIETPSQTEITIKGIDKQLVGQVAADIRAYRPPEPYKGKGVRYLNEVIILKEGKKK